ncbi:crotonase/enoyl-CoA hydratase family protein [Brachybacterium sp. EE-P12]|uniref:crotonase/enoyl-CoA hydratase family protein n=1 Tax=Brachybacterium sp. EE-P12 TaxID=2306299 RepID=UPI000F075946|nr:crotonase/enoyl-CoA hydratase family protein [Brachybacterium sp. EE-P12]
MSGGELVLTARHDHVRVLTLHRPHALNAIDEDLATALGDAVAEAEADPGTRVIVLTGAGRAFCAGMDLKAFARGESAHSRTRPERGFAGIVGHLVSVPVIAAVNGPAIGLGAELVLASDLAVIDPGAQLTLPEVRRGLIAAAGGVMRLPQQVPLKIALEKLLTGDPITSEQAREWGLVNAVSAPGAALEEALELAQRIAANAPLAVRATKDLVHATVHEDSWGRPAWRRIREAQQRVFTSEDAAEGAAAFAEKREPRWRGA